MAKKENEVAVEVPAAVETSFAFGTHEVVAEDGSVTQAKTKYEAVWELDYTDITHEELKAFAQRAILIKLNGVVMTSLAKGETRPEDWTNRTFKVKDYVYGTRTAKAKGPTLADLKAKRATMTKEQYMQMLIEMGVLEG